MSEVFIFELVYYIGAVVMFTLGMKLNFFLQSGQKGMRECLISFTKWYPSADLSPEPENKINLFKMVSNVCNIIFWIGLVLFLGLIIYNQFCTPLPYTAKYYMN